MYSVCSVGKFWTDQLIHFVDFEGSTVSGVLEYGVVSLRGGEIVAARGRLCRATGRVRAFSFGSEGEWIATVPRGFYLRASFTRALLRDPTALPI